MTDTRPCTCAPDERPYPCQHQYALGLCRKAEIRSLRAELDRCIAQIGDLAKLRSAEEVPVNPQTAGKRCGKCRHFAVVWHPRCQHGDFATTKNATCARWVAP